LAESLLINTFFFIGSSNNQKDAAYMNIKSISPSRISLKNLIIITQVSWNAINKNNSKEWLLTLYFFFVISVITVQPSWTSKENRPLTMINMDLLRFFVLGKKAAVIINLNCHPIISFIVIPSSGSAKKTLLVLPCVSLIAKSVI
jgi:hypothetical protein